MAKICRWLFAALFNLPFKKDRYVYGVEQKHPAMMFVG